MIDEFKFDEEYSNACLSGVIQDDKTIEKFLKWFKSPRDILYVCGGVGTGKTYFSAALYNDLKSANVPLRAFSEGYFMSDLKECIRRNWDPAGRIREICQSHLLILDDMGSSDITEWKKEMLFLFINDRYNSCKPTLITSNYSYSEMRQVFHERFASRIYAMKNTVIEIDGEDRRQNSRFLNKKREENDRGE